MSARSFRRTVLAIGVLALATMDARAQVGPAGEEPTGPRTPAPPTPPTASPVGDAPAVSPVGLPQIVVPDVVVPGTPSSLWTMEVRAQSYWDSNFRFTTPAEETFSERLGVTLAHAKRTARSTLALNADGWGTLYHATSDLNRLNGSAATSGTYELGPRTTLRGGASGSSVYSPESQELAAEGLILPLSRSKTMAATMGLLQRLGARTELSTDVRYDRASFSRVEDDEAIDPAALEGGSLLVLAAALAPQLNENDRLILGYDYQLSQTSGRSAGTHGLTLGWNRELGRRLAANASAGVSRFELVTDGSKGWAFRSVAGLSARFRRSALDARYERSIDQAFGFGRDRLSDILSAAYTVTASRKVRVRTTGVVGLTRDPGDPSFRFFTQTAMGELSYLLSRSLDVVTAYSFRRNKPETGPTVSGHGFGVSLAYTRGWRP